MLLDVSFLQFPSFDFSCLHFEVPYQRFMWFCEELWIGKMLKKKSKWRHEMMTWTTNFFYRDKCLCMDPKKLIFFCIICVFKNAYYNVGFDVFYLKKSFMWFCWRVMDEIRKIGKLLKKNSKWRKEMTWACTIFRFLNYFCSLKKHKSYYIILYNFSFRIKCSWNKT
jgi:hypothetical protein